MDISYRTYKERDISGLLSLMEELGYSILPADLQKTIEELHKRDGSIFVAEAAKKIIGSSSALIDIRLAEGISGEIASLVVAKEFRELGVGKKLINMAEKHLSLRVNTIKIRANVIREKAHNYYKIQGYQELKSQKIFYKSLK